MSDLLKFATLYENDFKNALHDLRQKYPYSINQIQKLTQIHKCLPVKEMLSLIEIQIKAKAKFPFADKWLFTDKNYQQASAYYLAQYHGRLFRNYQMIADLCCGLGSDLLFLSKFSKICYAIDINKDILEMAKFNMSYFKKTNIIYQNIMVEDFNEECDAVFIDPDRRKSNRRLICIDDLSPDYKTILSVIERYRNVAVKLSPMMDYEDSKLSDYSFEFISIDNELKECLLMAGALKSNKKAVILPEKIVFEEKKHPDTQIAEVKKWLLEPDTAIIRAHLVNDLAYELNMNRIDSQISLLSSDVEPNEKYGKKFFVNDVFNYNLKSLKAYITSHEIGALDIKTKGFSESVEDFRKKIKLKGKNRAVLFIVRAGDKHICIVTDKLS